MTAGKRFTLLTLILGFSRLCNAALLPETVGTNVCPDKHSACPEGATCCAEIDGSYGCCPLKHAVCCSDKLHCCPSHTVCDLPHQTCNNASIKTTPTVFSCPAFDADIVPISQIITGHAPHALVHQNGLKLNGITVCPDYRTACPDHYTCCPTVEGFGCCPVLHAVCCHDDDHCCPPSTQCDLTRNRCIATSSSSSSLLNSAAQSTGVMQLLMSWNAQPLLEKQAGMTVEASFSRDLRDGQVCPDGQSTCADGSTCCQIPGGGYGCCPYPKANCCSDGIHCCPAAYTCDVEHQQCKKQQTVVTSPMMMVISNEHYLNA